MLSSYFALRRYVDVLLKKSVNFAPVLIRIRLLSVLDLLVPVACHVPRGAVRVRAVCLARHDGPGGPDGSVAGTQLPLAFIFHNLFKHLGEASPPVSWPGRKGASANWSGPRRLTILLPR